MKIVNPATGASFFVEDHPRSITVGELKLRVKEQFSIPEKHQRLRLAQNRVIGCHHHNDLILAHFEVGYDDEVEVLGRLNGGCCEVDCGPCRVCCTIS